MSQSTSHPSSSSSSSPNVHVCTHPLVLCKLTQLRLHDLPAKDFREGVKAIGSMLVYEASRNLPLAPVPDLQSPIAPFTGHAVPLSIGLSPILRAGIGLTDAALDMFPDATVLHLGLFRDKATLQAIEYYSKLPTEVSADLVFVLDPLIATGGTAIAALAMLTEWGLSQSQIKIISVLGSSQGVEKVVSEYPGVEIYIGAVDQELTSKGYISPGLGDAGDRLFSTAK
ncbi:uracil phosphoribosyltransferase-domain-containing protein [Kockovaella imperatae]|uniref:uracil phosphoribosyltransferase n=1 Tax=Kockovaella imperatae TaxID=4999 RepID=A0A1Y1UIK3_9TREE|nr:uracil phosphoribosyltransferase-domain-containing protein [Kockovaella imperatae]ORX37878.1 uracil phosphoribosyltransferase-domain-containing protein [Kockovaella imperatae]